MCNTIHEIESSLLWITAKKTILTDRTMRYTGGGGRWMHQCVRDCTLFLCVSLCGFLSVCIFGAAPTHEPPSEFEFSLSSWLSPGRPWFLAEECMGVGSFNKGNSLSGPWTALGFTFHGFPPLCLWTQVGCCLCCCSLVSSIIALPWGWGKKTQREGWLHNQAYDSSAACPCWAPRVMTSCKGSVWVCFSFNRWSRSAVKTDIFKVSRILCKTRGFFLNKWSL